MIVSRVLVSVDREDRMSAQLTDRLDAASVGRLIGMLDEAARRLEAGEAEFLFACEDCAQALDGETQKRSIA